MNFLDSWIFKVALDKIFNKICSVLWQMCHAWITYGTVRRTFQTLGKFGGTSGEYEETCLFACFWDPYGSLAMLWLPIGVFVGLL